MNLENINLNDFRKLFYHAFQRGEILRLGDIFPYEVPLDIKEWYQEIKEQQFLWKNLDKKNIQEINFHDWGCVECITSEAKTRLEIPKNLSWEDLELSFQLLCYQNGNSWNFKRPFASFGIGYGSGGPTSGRSRITLLHSSLSPNKKWKAFIRFLQSPQSSAGPTYQSWIEDKKNILIAGPTRSGKTTFLKNLIQDIAQSDHLLIIEDTHELFVRHEKTTYMLTQDVSDPEVQHQQLKEFCSYAMRISPDRIVLGEMRGREVEAFLLLMNSGHRGMMSTIHSNSAVDAIHRAAMLLCLFQKGNAMGYDQALKFVAKNIDIVVYMEQLQIKEKIRIIGCDKGQVFFETL
ncbi:MAG: CpaF/VirB11 family protein [Bacteriovoracaceae bacterium]|nr:CpaF/VirB11 family protein [Bacteriovoracaceae bacterium]